MKPLTVLTKHNLLPRVEGGTEEDIAFLCEACHKHIHALYTNKELAIILDKIYKLKEDDQIGKYLKFIKKQPSTKQFRVKNQQTEGVKIRPIKWPQKVVYFIGHFMFFSYYK